VNLNRIQTKEQILAKPAGSTSARRSALSRPSSAHRSFGFGRANALELPISRTRQQSRLTESGHVSDLIQEKRSPFGQLEAPMRFRLGVREGAPDMPKSSLSKTPSERPPMFSVTSGRAARWKNGVQRSGDQAFSGAISP